MGFFNKQVQINNIFNTIIRIINYWEKMFNKKMWGIANIIFFINYRNVWDCIHCFRKRGGLLKRQAQFFFIKRCGAPNWQKNMWGIAYIIFFFVERRCGILQT